MLSTHTSSGGVWVSCSTGTYSTGRYGTYSCVLYWWSGVTSNISPVVSKCVGVLAIIQHWDNSTAI